jgi:Tfp pilus assembly protein PilF
MEEATAARVDASIDAFSRALQKNRGDKAYTLALAGALARGRRTAEADNLLGILRQAAPEDPDINLQLARLAASGGDTARATRFYRSALYAPWSSAEGPRRVRLELIRFLLAQGDTTAARAELVAAAANLPDDPAAHVQIGGLLRDAGDSRLALGEFEHALRLAPRQAAAAAGAGEAAFDLGEYAVALNYLRRAPGDPEAAGFRVVAELVLTRDPLAARLRSGDRRARLAQDAADVLDRVGSCSTTEPVLPDPELMALRPALAAAATTRGADPDAIQRGADAVDRAVQLLDMRCPSTSDVDRALTLIATRHGADRS